MDTGGVAEQRDDVGRHLDVVDVVDQFLVGLYLCHALPSLDLGTPPASFPQWENIIAREQVSSLRLIEDTSDTYSPKPKLIGPFSTEKTSVQSVLPVFVEPFGQHALNGTRLGRWGLAVGDEVRPPLAIHPHEAVQVVG